MLCSLAPMRRVVVAFCVSMLAASAGSEEPWASPAQPVALPPTQPAAAPLALPNGADYPAEWAVGGGTPSGWAGEPAAGVELASAESPESPASAAELTAEQLQRLQRDAETAADLSDEARKPITAALTAAAADLQLAADHAARAEAFRAEAAAVPQRLAEAQQKLEQPAEAAAAAPPDDATVAELEQHQAKLEATVAADKKARATLEGEPQARGQRRKDIRTAVTNLQTQLSELAPVVPAADEPPLATSARAAEQAARRRALSAELVALEAELAKYDAEDAANLVRVRTDLAARRVVEAEKLLAQTRELVKQRREQEAKESLRQAEMEVIIASQDLKSHAEHNKALAERAHALTQQLNEAEQELKAVGDACAALEKQFKQTKNRVANVGSISSVGALLRKQRKTLPDTSVYTESIAARRPVLEELEYDLFDYGDTRDELANLEDRAAEIVAEAPAGADLDFLAKAAKDILERQRDYLDQLMGNGAKYIETLSDLTLAEERYVDLVSTYEEFIDERVLWIRSGKSLANDYALDEADLAAMSPVAWARLGRQATGDLVRRPWAWGLFVVGFVAVASQGSRLRKSITAAGEVAEKANCRSIMPTYQAAVRTVLVAAVWPALLLAIGWRLRVAPDATGFAGAVGEGMWLAGWLWAPLELLRQSCRRNGLAQSHFGWSRGVTGALRRGARLLALVGLPIAAATTMLGALDASHGRDSLERTLFIAGMVVAAAVVFSLLAPGGVLKEYYAYNKGSWAERLRRLWPCLAAAAPIALGVLAFTGYYYTASTLAWRVSETVCFLATLVVLRSVALRMLMLRRRHLAMVQAKERAQAAAAAAAAGETAGGETAGIATSAPQADLVAHSEQTRRLVTTGMFAASVVGLWLIWVQVLPALGMLDEYKLWGGSAVASAPPPSSDAPALPGLPAVAPSETPATPAGAAPGEAVTLSDLALALLVAFVTFVIAKNGPGLLEMAVLQQLPMEASVRYAITTLVSYAIVLVGVVTSCSAIGLEWSQVQWLATALTFGLAFGLQEMFANFVAGLIILLERPIRVGDVVTVDSVTGVVSKIRIRATSITDWDRKEYVVPNKEFITGRLLNWTLSDKTNRIVINIGVAYGSDTERAREILLQVANDHPLILKDPPSLATFEGFGDNSLNLVLRTYLPTLDGRLDVIHHLHTEINRAFAREGIEIAFPQRDLHIRTAPAALMKAIREGESAPETATKDRKQNAA
ncbi:mechanosensitive ion channel domain-containing protein [Botrimarina sp.]|uniref:mechanosensitive ion channel domain-containing protein n=1 Tax=Botrimarina sp. TaxID=2795802 RepID=UPI0032EECB3F